MAGNAFDVQEGMEVFGSKGEKIGTISHIFSGAPFRTTDHQEAGTGPGTESVEGSPFGRSGMGPGSEADVEIETVLVSEVPIAGGSTDLGGAESGGMAPVAGFEGAGGAGAAVPAGGHATTFTPSDTKYFQVHHGGLLGIGGESLYIPFNAVEAITPGDCITLSCTRDEAAALYSQKPTDVVEK